VPRKQQRDRLISKLTIRHWVTIIVAGLHQHGQQIALVLAIGLSFANDALNDPIDPT
jgi:hypothetical protein